MREELLRHQTQALRLIRGRIQIQLREPHNIETDRKVIAAKNRMRAYMQANTDPVTDQVNVHLEVHFLALCKMIF